MTTVKANVNVRIDADIKELASQLFARMGLDQTTAIDMFFRQVIAERRLPFQPTVVPTLDEQLIAALEKSNPKRITFPTDENGSLIIDKDLYPDIYDWAMNG